MVVGGGGGEAGIGVRGGTWHWRGNDVGGEVVWVAGYFGVGRDWEGLGRRIVYAGYLLDFVE